MRLSGSVFLAVLGCCGAFGEGQSPANLVSNPSFEEQENGLPAGWRLSKNVSAAVEHGGAADGEAWLRLRVFYFTWVFDPLFPTDDLKLDPVIRLDEDFYMLPQHLALVPLKQSVPRIIV